MRLFVTLLLPLMLLACGPAWVQSKVEDNSSIAPGRASVCLDLPKERKTSVLQAVEDWNKALGRWRGLSAFGESDHPSQCDYWVKETSKNYTDKPGACAWASMVGGHEIWLRKDHYEQDVHGIALHELGHALGAQHIPGTLMSATWDPRLFECPDELTVVQVGAWNQVDLDLLSWCSH